MSTIKAANLQHPSSPTPNITLAADGTVVGLHYSNRNLLHNGAMQVHQRGTSKTSITGVGYNTADRYQLDLSALGTWTQSVEADGPTGSGLVKSLKMLCTTANAAPAADDHLYVQQVLEGQDLQRIAKGTASAQQLTLSFWVKSNVTGTYIANLYDGDNTRTVSSSYSVSASATWERKTITFPADSTGIFVNDNNASLYVLFGLGAGSNYTSGTLGTTWATAVNATRFVGQTNLAAATNNYWQITGVQLEVGTVATPFEFKSYADDLQQCLRYYYRISPAAVSKVFGACSANTTTSANVVGTFPVPMRVAPTALDQTGTATDYQVNMANVNTVCSAVPVLPGAITADGWGAGFTVASGLTAGQAGRGTTATSSAYLGWSADL
jgi:hypothetical protein